MKIAIMQPYYYPYAGYFRLFAAADLFVFLDNVQWNRRGRAHRYQSDGKWNTLPIKKTDRNTTRIMDMQWQEGEECELKPIDFIIDTLRNTCSLLGLNFVCTRSSEIDIDPELRGQDRIIAICKHLKATEYINSPGGKDLYEERTFEDNGIKLTFLPEYKGSYDSILERLAKEKPKYIRKEIMDNL